jgi:hypothetical protein
MPGGLNGVEALENQPDVFSKSTTKLLDAFSGHSDPSFLPPEHETQPLKRLHNETTSVCALPTEILSQIFLHLVTSCTEKGYSLQWDDDKDDISWMRVAHVCQRWREVAVDSPNLWSNLPLTHPEAVETFIRRSKAVPLSVEYHGKDPTSQEALVKALQSDAYRLYSLSITARDIKHLLSSVTGSAPFLKTLELFSWDADSLPAGFLRGGAPSLTHLQVQGRAFNWGNLPLNSGLTQLQLVQGRARVRPSCITFLSSLHALSSLKVLSLEQTLPDASTAIQVATESSLRLTLPALAHLTLHDSIQNVRHFFENAAFPRVSDIGLTLENANEDGFQRLMKAIKTCCYNSARSGPRFNDKMEVCRFSDDGFGRDVTLRPHREAFSQTFPSLNIDFCDWGPSFECLFSHLQAQFDFSELRRLSIGGLVALDVEQWKTTFGGISELKYIAFTGSSGACLLTILETLKERRPQDSDDQDAPPWFPALTKLECRDVEFSPGVVGEDKQVLIERLSEAVGRRSERRPPLELHILTCRKFVAEDEARIHRSVPNLKLIWDGWAPRRNERWDDL